MERKAILLPLAAAVLVLAAQPAMAKPDSEPYGPWVTPQQTVSLEAFHTYEELTKELMKIDRRSDLVEVESAGLTNENRDIWLVKIGDPSKTPVLIITQQHGDEPHGTESALNIIKYLGTGSQQAQQVLNELYVLIVPRVNPDGATYPTRGNADFTAPERSACACPAAGGVDPSCTGVFSTRFRGTDLYSYDINRYHWPDWTDSWEFQCFGTPTNPVPEAVAVRDVYDMYQPLWVIDVHNQGFNVVEDDADPDINRPNRYVTGSILWPTNDDVSDDARDLSKQLTVVMKEASFQYGNMEITRYNGGDYPGIARNAYGLLGSGSVLVEIAGQIEGSPSINIGQKHIGMLEKNVRVMLMSVLEATASGALFQVDPDRANTIIVDNDEGLDNPRLD